MSRVFVINLLYAIVGGLIGLALRILIRPYQPRKSYDEFDEFDEFLQSYDEFDEFDEFLHNRYKRRKNYNWSQQMTPASELDNAYRTLGVEPSWSLKKITIRYKDLMRSNHPDRLNLHRNSAGAVNCSQYNAAIAIIRSDRS